MLLKAQEILPQIKNCEPSEHGQVIYQIFHRSISWRQKICNVFLRMWFNRCRERERDGRTQVRGTVHNKGLTHIYLMTVFCEILTNYLKVVTLLATL